MKTGAAFLIGIVAGAALFGAGVGRAVETLHLERDRATARAEQLQAELTELQARERESTGPVLKGIDVLVDFGDERVALEMKRRLSTRLQRFLGRKAAQVEPLYVYAELQGRLLFLSGTIYRSQLLAVSIIGSRLVVHVRVEPVAEPKKNPAGP